MKQRILLIEDEDLIGTMVRLNLEEEGYAVEWAQLCAPGLEQARRGPFDLILLDRMLPDGDGVDVVRELRGAGIGTPVLMLTAKSDVGSKVESFRLGADDYLPKPFDMRELLARCKALIRRSQGEREVPAHRMVRIGGSEVNLDRRVVVTNDGEQPLSERETALIELFVRSAGQTLARADILEEVWGLDTEVTERTVDNMVVKLRRLFESDPDNPVLFRTVRGTGYRYEP